MQATGRYRSRWRGRKTSMIAEKLPAASGLNAAAVLCSEETSRLHSGVAILVHVSSGHTAASTPITLSPQMLPTGPAPAAALTPSMLRPAVGTASLQVNVGTSVAGGRQRPNISQIVSDPDDGQTVERERVNCVGAPRRASSLSIFPSAIGVRTEGPIVAWRKGRPACTAPRTAPTRRRRLWCSVDARWMAARLICPRSAQPPPFARK